MMNTDQSVALWEPVRLREMSGAIAMIDEQGTVAAWTRAAQHLVGYCAEDVVGRSATLVLPSYEEMLRVSALPEQYGAQGGWSGTTAVRHRDGHTLNLCLRLSLLRGQGLTRRWLVSLTDMCAFSSRMMNGSVRESLLARAPVGIVIRDPQLRCIWVNDAMARFDGISPARRLGRHLKDALPGFEAEALEAVMRQVLASGTSAVHEYRAWPPEDPHREHAFSALFFCLQDADGQALGVCSISVDVTGNQPARERLAILSQAGTRIGSTLDIMQTAEELAGLAVPLLADYVTVDLAESNPSRNEPATRIDTVDDRPQVFRRAGSASIHPGIPEPMLARGETISVPPNSPLADALRTGRSHLEPVVDTTHGTWIDHDPAWAQKIRENGVHSLMIVPIRARRSLLGLAFFARTEDPVPFQEDDLLLAEELVTRAALCLDNARQYTRERSTALALQRDLLPRRLRGGVAVAAAGRYVPADTDAGVGGDWFDVIPLSGARVALVVGDVVGHGINAAAAMGRLRTSVRTLADLDLPPDELLSHLDDSLQRLTREEEDDAPDQIPAIMGATCLYAVYDPTTRQCTMARAGHPPPAIIDPQGQVTFPDLPTGAPLGLGLGLVPFESVEMELPEGSMLAFYTDGLVESRDEDIDVGMHRLANALAQPLAQPEQPLEDLCSSVMETVPTRAAADDATVLLVRVHTLNAAHIASWDLPAEPAVVCTARHLAAQQLSAWGLEHLVPTMELIVSELVTNAIHHGTGPIRLRLTQHQALTCEVFDSRRCYPRLRHARSVDEGGRGLYLIAQLSSRWGFRSAMGGKLVWAEQDLGVPLSGGHADTGSA